MLITIKFDFEFEPISVMPNQIRVIKKYEDCLQLFPKTLYRLVISNIRKLYKQYCRTSEGETSSYVCPLLVLTSGLYNLLTKVNKSGSIMVSVYKIRTFPIMTSLGTMRPTTYILHLK